MTQAKKGEKTLFLSIYHYFFHLCELSLYSATTVCFIQLCRGFDFLVPLTFPDDEYAIRQADLLLTRIKSLFVHIQWVKARRQECAESVENVQHWLKMWDRQRKTEMLRSLAQRGIFDQPRYKLSQWHRLIKWNLNWYKSKVFN